MSLDVTFNEQERYFGDSRGTDEWLVDTNTTIMPSCSSSSAEATNQLVSLPVMLPASEGDAHVVPPPKDVDDGEYPIVGQHTSTLPAPDDNSGVVSNFDADATDEGENHSSTSPIEAAVDVGWPIVL